MILLAKLTRLQFEINGVPAAWYRTVEEYQNAAFNTLTYILDGGDEYVEVCFWLDGDLPVAFVFYEAPVTSTYFVLRPGYEFLAGEMIGYAETAWPEFDEPRELNLLSGQKTLIEEAEKRGYTVEYEEPDMIFDFRKGKLDYPLPEGYHFVNARASDPLKSAKCLWDGFNSEELGEFVDWEIPKKAGGLSPHELYQNVLCASIAPSPHATYDYTVIIADANEDYVCFSGMWWIPDLGARSTRSYSGASSYSSRKRRARNSDRLTSRTLEI